MARTFRTPLSAFFLHGGTSSGSRGRGRSKAKSATAAALLIAAASVAPTPAWSQNAQVQVLERVESLEESIKDIRRVLEEDIRALRQSVDGQGGLSGQDAVLLREQIGALANRLERALSIVSDNEFRMLRLEKRVDSLLRAGIEQSLSETARPAGTGAGSVPSSSINARVDQKTLWSIDNSTLQRELTTKEGAEPATDQAGERQGREEPARQGSIALANAAPNQADGLVLPEGDPEEQYQFALGKALQNDLAMAEQAFSEFIERNAEHDRVVDSYFWLGRVQFMNGSYEESVKTFSTFQSQWPGDSRIEKTTLWIGESVVNFASRDDACEFLESLPSLVPEPTDSFDDRLAKLKTSAECPE